jgi:hypothetical protein
MGVRRVVTGHTPDGVAVVVSDEEVALMAIGDRGSATMDYDIVTWRVGAVRSAVMALFCCFRGWCWCRSAAAPRSIPRFGVV